jgi:hypothetical protein
VLQTVALTYLELLLKEKEFGLMLVTMSKVIKVGARAPRRTPAYPCIPLRTPEYP